MFLSVSFSNEIWKANYEQECQWADLSAKLAVSGNVDGTLIKILVPSNNLKDLVCR